MNWKMIEILFWHTVMMVYSIFGNYPIWTEAQVHNGVVVIFYLFDIGGQPRCVNQFAFSPKQAKDFAENVLKLSKGLGEDREYNLEKLSERSH